MNLDKLEENLHLPVLMKVTLYFEHKNQNYIIERKMQMIKEGKDSFTTREFPPTLNKISDTGDFEQMDQNIDLYINNFLHRDIREFFFFDAEKMELLNNTRSQRKMTQEVKEGIVKLLQLKSLGDAERIIKRLIDTENKKIAAKAKDSDINKKQNEKLELERRVKILEEENVVLSRDRDIALREIESSQQALSSNEKIRDLQKERSQLESSLQDSLDLFSEQKSHVQSLINQSSDLLAIDFLQTKELEFKEIKESQKDTIPLDMIESTLSKCRCELCNQSVETNSLSYKYLKDMEKSYVFSDLTPIINSIQTTTQKLQRTEKSLKEKIDSYINKIVQTQEAIDKKELAIEKIDAEIKGKAALLENLQHIEQNLSNHEENERKLKNQKVRNELELKNIYENIEKINEDIYKLTLKYDDLKIDSQIVEKLREMKQLLSTISSSYTEEITDELSIEMTRTFKNLLSRKDRPIFDEVIINESYEIAVLDKTGTNRVQELSMGQGQIFTLAFITTLAKLASKGRTEVNFPLFMDTPFGRISGENRDNLIKEIPEITNQWILLLTDTELTRIEQKAFSKYNKVGKVYELINIDGKTDIIEVEHVNKLNVRG